MDMRLESIKMSLRPALGSEIVDGPFQWIKDIVPMRWDKDTNRLVEAEVSPLGGGE